MPRNSISKAVTVLGFVTLSAFGAGVEWKLPPETVKFKPAPGVELATANCLLCHSADYVSIQPTLKREAWQAIVVKMREKFAAPLPKDKDDAIVDYLTTNYGAGKK
jgi:mono/diheme cytochrome c family protein